MSWEAYVTNLETGTGQCKFAAIYGREGGLWAETKDKSSFPVTPTEVITATNALIKQDSGIYCNGLMMGGNKFTCIRMEPDILVCQGKDDGKKEQSLVIAIGNQAVIIGMNPDANIKTAFVRGAVENIRDYLRTQGY